MTERELIDGLFYVEQSRWKTWKSFSLEGEPLIIALHRDLCIQHTHFYLKGRQENWHGQVFDTYEGEVGGKL
jgi:hypothetical protein